MLELHKKIYASIVGDVDNTIAYIAELLTHEACGKTELVEVGKKLKDALLKAENMYIEGGE